MWTVASDIDGTLTGDSDALLRLGRRIAQFRAVGGYFIMVTGRPYLDVLSGLANECLPEPDAIIAQVGTEIYLPSFKPGGKVLESWRAALLASYDYAEALTFVDEDLGWRLQPPECNTELKASWYYRGEGDADLAAEKVCAAVRESARPYRVIWSSGRDLDILPASSGKSGALEHLLGVLQRPVESCVVAGDSGNDLDMVQRFPCAIVVANAQSELVEYARQNPRSGLKVVANSFAAGVEEGLDFLGVLPPLGLEVDSL